MHPAEKNALDFEKAQISTRFEQALERLKGFARRDSESWLKELVYKLLTSRVLCAAAGGYEQPNGYTHWFQGDSNEPLLRMEFIVFFIGHELLDDGDPGIGWQRWTGGCPLVEDCPETHPRAQPYFHCCHEILPPGSKRLGPDEVLWVLDWHEKKEAAYFAGMKEDYPNDPGRPPENPLLVDLAKAICYPEQPLE